jgi:hypothetical protein
MNKDKVQLSCVVDQETKNWLRKEADRTGRSVNWVVTSILKDYLEKEKITDPYQIVRG